MSDFRHHADDRPPALVLGYAQMPEPAIRAGVRGLSEVVRTSEPSLVSRRTWSMADPNRRHLSAPGSLLLLRRPRVVDKEDERHAEDFT
jgi:hypothetical protein